MGWDGDVIHSISTISIAERPKHRLGNRRREKLGLGLGGELRKGIPIGVAQLLHNCQVDVEGR
jgi:hypothetical protein